MSTSTVCDQCKRRKKSCNKARPSCSRCSRLLVKCTYPDPMVDISQQTNILPPLINVLPGLLPQHSTSNIRIPSNINSSHNNSHQTGEGNLALSNIVETQISTQAAQLFDAISRGRIGLINSFCEIYFETFHQSLPILNKESFYHQLQSSDITSNPHFSILLLSVILITQLYPHPDDFNGSRNGGGDSEKEYAGLKELYTMLKSVYFLLQSTGKVSEELLQAGLHIAAWEHNQALQSEAWLSVGGCARMANMLGLHTVLKFPLPDDAVERRVLVNKRCLWFGVVILERVIHAVYEDDSGFNTLHCISPGPALDDFLPGVPEEVNPKPRVIDDLLPEMIGPQGPQLSSREFSHFGAYAGAVQATYLADLVTDHIQRSRSMDKESRKAEVAKLSLLTLSVIICSNLHSK